MEQSPAEIAKEILKRYEQANDVFSDTFPNYEPYTLHHAPALAKAFLDATKGAPDGTT